MPAPKVSVLIRTYNAEAYVAQALDSALAQRLDAPYEILVSDDCSTDGTRGVVAGYARHYPDVIRPFLRRQRLGILANLVETLAEARGEYVAVLDGDDYWTSPFKLSMAVDILDSEPGVAAVVHDVEYVDGKGNPLPRPPAVDRNRDYATADILRGIAGLFGTLVFRRGPIVRAFAERPWCCGECTADWGIQVIASLSGTVRRIEERMTAYRVREGSVWSNRTPLERLPEVVAFYEGIQGYLQGGDKRLAADLHARHRVALARHLARRGELGAARGHVWHVIRSGPMPTLLSADVVRCSLEVLFPWLFAGVRTLRGVKRRSPSDGEELS